MRAEIRVPHTVMVPRGAKWVDVDVLCSLHNDDGADRVLSARNPDDAHFWHVLDDNQREVQRRPATRGGAPRSRHVVEATSHAQPVTVRLNAAKLKDGRTYTLRYRRYGVSSEADFTVFHQRVAPAAPARARKRTRKKAAARKTARAAGARKTTRKKAARKKPAPKKAARKAVARKPAAKKAARKKAVRKKPARKKPVRKKAARKKPAAKKAARKKTPARRKAVARRRAAKKRAVRRRVQKKSA